MAFPTSCHFKQKLLFSSRARWCHGPGTKQVREFYIDLYVRWLCILIDLVPVNGGRRLILSNHVYVIVNCLRVLLQERSGGVCFLFSASSSAASKLTFHSSFHSDILFYIRSLYSLSDILCLLCSSTDLHAIFVQFFTPFARYITSLRNETHHTIRASAIGPPHF